MGSEVEDVNIFGRQLACPQCHREVNTGKGCEGKVSSGQVEPQVPVGPPG